jgi:hypothetical protein
MGKKGEITTRHERRKMLYLQLPITRGHDCQSIGNLCSCIGHFALIVNLNGKEVKKIKRDGRIMTQ